MANVESYFDVEDFNQDTMLHRKLTLRGDIFYDSVACKHSTSIYELNVHELSFSNSRLFQTVQSRKSVSEISYYDYYTQPMDDSCTNGQVIEIELWLHQDKQVTTRKAQTMLDLISEVGGLSSFLHEIFVIVVSFATSKSLLYMLLPQLYAVKTKKERRHKFKQEESRQNKP